MKYERLTCRHPNGEVRIMETKFNSDEAMQTAVNRLAELEDKIEDGTLPYLPCKVGDTVYSNERIMFEPAVVRVITTHQSVNLPVSYTVLAVAKDGYQIYLSSENFNEDWFLTREKAEKRLEELQK